MDSGLDNGAADSLPANVVIQSEIFDRKPGPGTAGLVRGPPGVMFWEPSLPLLGRFPGPKFYFLKDFLVAFLILFSFSFLVVFHLYIFGGDFASFILFLSHSFPNITLCVSLGNTQTTLQNTN